jgi:hydroxymethylpyrimidine pyrophosphatase-like HAD family hydrolase
MQPDNNVHSDSARSTADSRVDSAIATPAPADDPFRELSVADNGFVRLANLLQRNGVSGLSPHTHRSIVSKVEARVAEGKDVIILFADVDGTLTPSLGSQNDVVMRRQNDAMREFVSLVRDQQYIFIPITGSSYEVPTETLPSLSERIHSGSIPAIFDALIVEGGNKVVLTSSSESEIQYDEKYKSHVAKRVERFQKGMDEVLDVCEELMQTVRSGQLPGGETLLGLRSNSANFRNAQELIRSIEGKEYTPEMRIALQPHVHPAERSASLDKVSLHFYATSMRDRDLIEEMFVDAFPWLNVVCCEERDFNSKAETILKKQTQLKKYCLDVTPVTKATPIDVFSKFIGQITRYYNSQLYSNAGRPSSLMPVYFGDAGNDIPAANSALIRKVCMVSGSSGELLRAHDDLSLIKDAVFIDSDRSRPGVASMLTALREWKLA